MNHVIWIGGPPRSGKTTVARWLARRHGFRLYSADTMTWAHRDRALAAGNQAARRWEGLTEQQRWAESSVAKMLEMSLHSERGHMVVEDVRGLPDTPTLIAEGSTVPAWVAGEAERRQMLWLIPTPAFQRDLLVKAGVGGGRARLYEHLGEVIGAEARRYRIPAVSVDGNLYTAQLCRHVESQLADAIAGGTRAATPAERQVLLREANEAIVRQVRAYFQRPWATGDPDTVTRSFVCECGTAGCQIEIRAETGRAAARPILAPNCRDRI